MAYDDRINDRRRKREEEDGYYSRGHSRPGDSYPSSSRRRSRSPDDYRSGSTHRRRQDEDAYGKSRHDAYEDKYARTGAGSSSKSSSRRHRGYDERESDWRRGSGGLDRTSDRKHDRQHGWDREPRPESVSERTAHQSSQSWKDGAEAHRSNGEEHSGNLPALEGLPSASHRITAEDATPATSRNGTPQPTDDKQKSKKEKLEAWRRERERKAAEEARKVEERQSGKGEYIRRSH